MTKERDEEAKDSFEDKMRRIKNVESLRVTLMTYLGNCHTGDERIYYNEVISKCREIVEK